MVTQQVESLLAHGGAAGIVGLLALLFFSSAAFARVRYLGRLSGPLLDRIDVHAEVRRCRTES